MRDREPEKIPRAPESFGVSQFKGASRSFTKGMLAKKAERYKLFEIQQRVLEKDGLTRQEIVTTFGQDVSTALDCAFDNCEFSNVLPISHSCLLAGPRPESILQAQ